MTFSFTFLLSGAVCRNILGLPLPSWVFFPSGLPRRLLFSPSICSGISLEDIFSSQDYKHVDFTCLTWPHLWSFAVAASSSELWFYFSVSMSQPQPSPHINFINVSTLWGPERWWPVIFPSVPCGFLQRSTLLSCLSVLSSFISPILDCSIYVLRQKNKELGFTVAFQTDHF